MRNQEYLNEMLHLTADIAEELLTLKDTGNELSDGTTEKIARLAELAISYRTLSAVTSSETTAVLSDNKQIIDKESPLESDGVPQFDFASYPEPEAAVEIEDIERRSIEGTENMVIGLEPISEQSDYPDKVETCHEEHIKTSDKESAAYDNSHPKILDSIEIEVIQDAYTTKKNHATAPSRKPHFSAREFRNAFTLNDVFLFQRALFHGSSIEFKQALEEISALSDLRELEEYLVSAHGIDLTTQEAEDFIKIVTAFF